MGIIKGQNLRISVDGKIIAAATSCQIHISANLEESSTKDNTGGWTEQECTGKAWDASADALVLVDTAETGLVAFDAAALVGSDVAVTFDLTNGAQNRVVDQAIYTGTAIVNDFSLTAGNKQNSTYTIQLTGKGELTKVTE